MSLRRELNPKYTSNSRNINPSNLSHVPEKMWRESDVLRGIPHREGLWTVIIQPSEMMIKRQKMQLKRIKYSR
jgi:hypothetical protein